MGTGHQILAVATLGAGLGSSRSHLAQLVKAEREAGVEPESPGGGTRLCPVAGPGSDGGRVNRNQSGRAG